MKSELGKFFSMAVASAAVAIGAGASLEVSLIDSQPIEEPCKITISQRSGDSETMSMEEILGIPDFPRMGYPFLVTDCPTANCGECACACNCDCWFRGACDCICETGGSVSCDCRSLRCYCECLSLCLTHCFCDCNCIGKSCAACNCNCINICLNECFIKCACDCACMCDCNPTPDCVIAVCV